MSDNSSGKKCKNIRELRYQYPGFKKSTYAASPHGFQAGSTEYEPLHSVRDRRQSSSHLRHRCRLASRVKMRRVVKPEFSIQIQALQLSYCSLVCYGNCPVFENAWTATGLNVVRKPMWFWYFLRHVNNSSRKQIAVFNLPGKVILA